MCNEEGVKIEEVMLASVWGGGWFDEDIDNCTNHKDHVGLLFGD